MKYASEIRFVLGRLNFNESKNPAPFPCVVVIFDKSRLITLELSTLSTNFALSILLLYRTCVAFSVTTKLGTPITFNDAAGNAKL